MVIKIPICKSIQHEYLYNKKYIYTNKLVFIFIVILSSLIIYAKLENILGCRPSLLIWVKVTNIHSFSGCHLSVLISVATHYLIGGFSWGDRLAPSCSFFVEKCLTVANILIAPLLPDTGGISGVINKARKIIN